jgi:integrase
MRELTIRFHPQNERIKQAYFLYQKEADQKSDSTIDAVRKAIVRFEMDTGFKDFKTFNKEQAIAFKKHLAKQKNLRTGQPISKSTMLSTINALQAFFRWLAYQPGYKSKIHIPDIEYLNMSEKDIRTAKAVQFKEFPTIEQIRKVIFDMPTGTEVERRDQALIAFTLLTGMRDSAIASLSLKHIDTSRDPVLVRQDPNEVRTKFSKTINTYFFPIGDDIRDIALNWIRHLKEEKLYGLNDPVFPSTKIGQDENLSFTNLGIEPVHWSSASPIRKIFKQAFTNAGLKYYTPHLFRNTLADLGQKICKTPEQLKAWSQNLGHENVLTTFTSYGNIDPHRQGEVIKGLSVSDDDELTLQNVLAGIQNMVSRTSSLPGE